MKITSGDEKAAILDSIQQVSSIAVIFKCTHEVEMDNRKKTTYDQKDENLVNHNQFIPIDWRALEECSLSRSRLFPLF
jgi:hypothetical protein